MFNEIDTNNDGRIDYNELYTAFKAYFHDEVRAKNRCDEIFNAVDIDGSKTLDFNEFLLVSYETDKSAFKKMKKKFNEIY